LTVTAMPSHTSGIPKLADTITCAVYQSLNSSRIDSLNVIYASWSSGRPKVVRRSLSSLPERTACSSNLVDPCDDRTHALMAPSRLARTDISRRIIRVIPNPFSVIGAKLRRESGRDNVSAIEISLGQNFGRIRAARCWRNDCGQCVSTAG
jgi:hypothetical protein